MPAPHPMAILTRHFGKAARPGGMAFLLLAAGCGEKKILPLSPGDSVLRVTATIQHPDFQRPWLKKQPFTRAGLGTVLSGNRILVTADLVAHSTCIELERAEAGPKGTARIEAIDEECNLCVLKPLDIGILAETRPLSLDTTIRTGSHLDILQLEANGAAAITPATVTTVAVMPYPNDGGSFILYRAAATIPPRETSYVLPALHDGMLAGLVMRYDARTQAADIIPAPLVARFLKESAKPGNAGLARAGLSWEELRGGTLREWLGAGPERTGVYVTRVDSDGPAAKAGLRRGDLLLKAAGKTIDGEGNILDPIHGKITFNNLASLESAPGDPMEITYFRSNGAGRGIRATTTIFLSGRNSLSEISPVRMEGDKVPHVFLGGLLFQELSRPYLRDWGANWRLEAPQNLVYLDAYQDEFPRSQGRFVILSSVLPTPRMIGLQNISNRVVEKINGREIHGLSDVTEAAKHPENGFHRITLEGSVGPVYLDAATLASEEEAVKARYGIPPDTQ